jgi:glycosyltransferase involved in cell wall biosynthesis
MNKVLLAIPCYNCEKQISRVLDKLTPDLLSFVTEIVLIDNKSTDGTAGIIQNKLNLKNDERYHLIVNEENIGLGGSFVKALDYGKIKEFTYMIWFHGDDQACVKDIENLYNKISGEEKYAVVFGARFMKRSNLQNYSRKREFANRILNWIFTICTRVRIYELGSGLNIYRLDILQKSDLSLPSHIAFDIKLLLFYITSKLKVKFEPISWYEEDQVSNAPNLKVTVLIFKELLNWMFKK